MTDTPDPTRPEINTGRRLTLIGPAASWAPLPDTQVSRDDTPRFDWGPPERDAWGRLIERMILTNEGLKDYLSDTNNCLMSMLPQEQRRSLRRRLFKK